MTMEDKSSKLEVVSEATNYLRKAGLTDGQIHALGEIGYFDAPASQRHHLACETGLARHSMHVTDQLIALGVFADEASAYRVGMLHDLVKCYNYELDLVTREYTKKAAHYPGHGVASVLIAADLGIGLSDEEKQAVIWHMGAFALKDRETSDAYDAAKLRYPRQIILTHAADHLATALEDADARAALQNEGRQ